MSHTVTVTKLQDGPRNVVLHVFIQGDEQSLDLTDYVLLDPLLDLDPAEDRKPIFTLKKVYYDLVNFSVKLSYEYLTDGTPVWVFSGAGQNLDFSELIGLHDKSNTLDGSGKVLLSTHGLDLDGYWGTMILHFRKH